MIARVLNLVVRRAATWPLQVVDAGTRAEALERLSNGMVVCAPIAGGDLKFFAPTPLLRSRAESVLTKEPDTVAWLNTLQPDDVLWDVGANVGVFSVYAAAVRRCRVLAFEPSASNYYVLTRNISLNALEPHIAAYCLALSGQTGIGVLNLDSSEPGAALSQFGRAGEGSPYSSNARPAQQGMIGFSIDDFIARFGVAVPTRLKIDVDGLEWSILQGAQRTLNDARLTAVIVELSLTDGVERERAVAWMRECGLLLVSQGAAQGQAGRFAANHVFARQP